MNKNRTAIYGGTFDPPTLGHLDVIRRAAALFDTLYIAVLVNSAKNPVLSTDRRVEMLKKITLNLPNVMVESFSGLLTEYARNKKAAYSVRGIRNGTDLEYERPMFELNAQIAREEYGFELDTIFIPTTRENMDTSSANVRMLLNGGIPAIARKYLPADIADEVCAAF